MGLLFVVSTLTICRKFISKLNWEIDFNWKSDFICHLFWLVKPLLIKGWSCNLRMTPKSYF